MIKAIIIDDENLAREVVRGYLQAFEDIELVAECENGFEGIKAIQELNPDLVFLDVQMPKLTGFEMLELLDDPPVIIFSTAYDQYALKAFELNAVDYLLKPYDKVRFEEAVAKAREKIHQQGSTTDPQKLAHAHREQQEQLDRIVIRNGSKILIIPVDQVDYFEAQNDYVAVHSEGKKYLKKFTMKWLERALPANRFVRVHRSYIVAVDMIDKLEAYSKDAYLAMLKNGQKVPVSRAGYQLLRESLKF
ncbi:MAG: LytTR family transcriptional regulator DNA-binding domain-containing protein [Fulvivirga sp.]|nr:LytTR family transcriptional regulator DNA-binding domain-containing protein [Fulvivirga sp.]